jgi:hypothetical protein
LRVSSSFVLCGLLLMCCVAERKIVSKGLSINRFKQYVPMIEEEARQYFEVQHNNNTNTSNHTWRACLMTDGGCRLTGVMLE